jgi:hypothetical protein
LVVSGGVVLSVGILTGSPHLKRRSELSARFSSALSAWRAQVSDAEMPADISTGYGQLDVNTQAVDKMLYSTRRGLIVR